MQQLIFAICITTSCYASDSQPRSERDESLASQLFKAGIIIDGLSELYSNINEQQHTFDYVCNGARAALALLTFMKGEAESSAAFIYMITLAAHATYRYATGRGTLRKTSSLTPQLLPHASIPQTTKNNIPNQHDRMQEPEKKDAPVSTGAPVDKDSTRQES